MDELGRMIRHGTEEKEKMKTARFDLYQEMGLDRPAGAAAELTCYLPQETELWGVKKRLRPAVLILPGGGYEYCSAREAEPVALQFTARGWAAYVLVYSCAPHVFPTALREAAAAMRFIRDNAEKDGVDPHMVAAIGFSAGGHLCATLGTMFDAPEVADIAAPADIRPDALGLCYPVALSHGRTHAGSIENISGGDKALAERLSIEKLVRPDMCPVFLWHTRDDGSVPCRSSLLVAVALEEAGVPFALHVYAHGQHGLSVANELVFPSYALPEISADVPEWYGAMIRFFTEKGLRIHDEGEKR